ncbi:MAG: polysaccharide biosynthesis protein [Victivallales bacterium]|nr:polysaccharide biosynthesis protein [Victivallales bacterium]
MLTLVFLDILSVMASYYLALFFRFDCDPKTIEPQFLRRYYLFIPYYAIATVAVYGCLHLYRSIWRFASYREMMRCIIATVVTSLIHIVMMSMVLGTMPKSYYLFGAIMQACCLVGTRFFRRFQYLMSNRMQQSHRGEVEHKTARVMLIGGGAAGQMILRDLTLSQLAPGIDIRCIIDDDPSKWNCAIDDIPIIGGRESIPYAVKKYSIDKIFLAIPTATPQERKEVLDICKETRCELKTLPGMYQLANGEVRISNMRDVSVEDLLGREPIVVNNDEIFKNITQQVILVTGGGGSIGSELCRQIAAHQPKQLIIFDIYENNAYDIQQELLRSYPELSLVVLIGSVRDSKRIEDVFDTYHPDLVFHAAAHKHVPLMEDSPCEAVKNNVIGTYKTAFAALTHGCKRFLLISTDKAVNPTNIMGASKRICEMIIQTMDRVSRSGDLSLLPHFCAHGVARQSLPQSTEIKTHTEFVAVRFGNVLGSNGSVIPLFKKQIAAGGPVTVTDKEITRFFMTIPEAVSLVLQAATYANGGEIFVLDMGEPVKIDTLARNLIKLSGLRPDEDIRIVYTGLRPGEKLYEEKLMSEEGLAKTANKLIHVARPIEMDLNEFLMHLEELMRVSQSNDKGIFDVVAKTVPTFMHNAGGR